jgi:hypothetical protein
MPALVPSPAAQRAPLPPCAAMPPAAAAAAAAGAAPRKLRILCLHGYVQSAAVFRERTGSLRKALKAVAEFDFVEAPHDASGAFPESSGARDADADAGAAGADAAAHGAAAPAEARGWWSAGENAAAASSAAGWTRPSVSRCAVGYDASLAALRTTLAERGPYDGVLGFSQGAAMAALLLAAEPSCARFAILIAGFIAHDDALAGAMAAAAPLPHAVLSVSGESDALVEPARVRALAACFAGPSVRCAQRTRAACVLLAGMRACVLRACVLRACVRCMAHPRIRRCSFADAPPRSAFASQEFYAHLGGHGVPSNAAFRAVARAFLSAQASPV